MMRRNLHRAEVVRRLIHSNTNYEGDTQNSKCRKLKEGKKCMHKDNYVHELLYSTCTKICMTLFADPYNIMYITPSVAYG